MTTAVSFVLAHLLSPSLGPPTARAAPAVAAADGSAWAVVRAQRVWLCWDPRPQCFALVEFEAPASALDGARHSLEPGLADLDHETPSRAAAATSGDPWQLGFVADSLWVRRGVVTWRVSRGQRRALVVEGAAPVELERPRPRQCGPRAQVPAVIGAALGWQAAPRCEAPTSESCLGPVGPRIRRPSAVHVRAGFELVRSIRSASRIPLPGPALRMQARAELAWSMVFELRFDLAGARAHERARARAIRPRELRSLPPISPGPLADEERAALRGILCAEDRP